MLERYVPPSITQETMALPDTGDKTVYRASPERKRYFPRWMIVPLLLSTVTAAEIYLSGSPEGTHAQEPQGEYIILFKEDQYTGTEGLSSLGVPQVSDLFEASHGAMAHVAADPSQVEDIRTNPAVELMAPDETGQSLKLPENPQTSETITTFQLQPPNDYYYLQQVYLHPEMRFGINWINILPEEPASGIKVADCDTGATPHEDQPVFLTRRTVVPGDLGDHYDHGTGIIGFIAANTDNFLGITGISPRTRTDMWNMYQADGSGAHTSDIANCLYRSADSDAQIIMLEVHFPQGASSETQATLSRAINYASGKGKMVTGSCGNEGKAACNVPANLPGVVTVSATNLSGRLVFRDGSWASNWQPGGTGKTEFCAPATDLWWLNTQSSKYDMSDGGTSAAQAIYAAVAARIWGTAPGMSREQVYNRIAQTATKTNVDERCGYGIPNLRSAIAFPTITFPRPGTVITGTTGFQFSGSVDSLLPGFTVQVSKDGGATWQDAAVSGTNWSYQWDNIVENPGLKRFLSQVIIDEERLGKAEIPVWYNFEPHSYYLPLIMR